MYQDNKLTYTSPLNMIPEWAHLFKPDYEFEKVNLKVKELKNVFVNHYGLVIKNGLLVKGCAPNIGFSDYDDGFYYSHWRKAIEQMLVSKFGKSISSVKLDDSKRYLLIHSPWFSYYFWITECIPRLLMVRQNLSELTLIYPESWKKFRFVNDTLSLFPELEKVIIPSDYQLFVKNLVMPEVKPWTPMFIPEQVVAVRQFLFDAVEKLKIPIPNSKNVYLSRRDSKTKNFENEKEVASVLEKYEYTNIAMSDLSLFQQVALMKQTKNLISITGAGMSNFTFIGENANVLDMTNVDYTTTGKYKFHFWKLLNIVNANYFVQFCDHTNHPHIPRYSLQNLIADTDLLKQNLTLIHSNI
jgi:hypothetical protein